MDHVYSMVRQGYMVKRLVGREVEYMRRIE